MKARITKNNPKQNTETNYWHEPFYAAFRKELEEYKNVLKFLEEPKINTDSLFADLIVIKKKENAKIKKSIARAFKKYNIVEYKSPKSGLSVRVFNKALAYTTLYAANENIKLDDITLTLIGNKHPRELLQYLKKDFEVKETESGIYVLEFGNILVQIIETKALNKKENRLLYALGNKLSAQELDETLKQGLTDDKLIGYIKLILKENAKPYKELNMMSDEQLNKMLENSRIGQMLIQKGIKEGEKRGEKRGIQKGRLLERQKILVKAGGKKPVAARAV